MSIQEPVFDALIFDIDGTLWNASPASAKGWNQGLAKLGVNQAVTPAQVEQVAGHPFEACVEILLPGISTKIPDLFETLNTCETEVVKAEGGRFYKGVLEGIRKLTETYKIFLVSNCQEWYLNLFLEFSELKPWLIGYDCHGLSGLPKQAMLSRLKQKYDLRGPIYIGDTAGDEAAAKLAGMPFCFVSWGFGNPAGRPKTFDSFDDLLRFFISETK